MVAESWFHILGKFPQKHDFGHNKAPLGVLASKVLSLMSKLSSYNVKPVSSNSTLEASFSPDGTYVISSSCDGSVHAWSIRTGKEVASWMTYETELHVINGLLEP